MGRAVKNKGKRISVWNWMGTLLLCCIPGVNLIALILFIIFAKSSSKRGFAIAGLVLTLLFGVLICAAFAIFPQQLSELAETLRAAGTAHLLVTPAG